MVASMEGCLASLAYLLLIPLFLLVSIEYVIPSLIITSHCQIFNILGSKYFHSPPHIPNLCIWWNAKVKNIGTLNNTMLQLRTRVSALLGAASGSFLLVSTKSWEVKLRSTYSALLDGDEGRETRNRMVRVLVLALVIVLGHGRLLLLLLLRAWRTDRERSLQRRVRPLLLLLQP